ncbi:hypothetical protein ACS0TY_009887 [Phlomoides rotata]
MASISNPSLIHQSRFSSSYRTGLIVSRASHLEFSHKINLSKPVNFSGKSLRKPGLNELLNLRGSSEFCITKVAAADANADGHEIEVANGFTKAEKSFGERFPALVTGFFFFTWYFLNVIFNILNKKVYNYFPYPFFVSVIHLLVGVVYCLISWGVGLPKRAPIDKQLLGVLTPVAFCHALGHVMSNVSFAAVAVSFTHTVKALEPFFSAAASQFVLGHQIPLPLWLSLAPVVLGVSMASMTELSFNWTGFTSAMISNISFTYRSIYSKKAMTGMDSTNIYAYISIIALLFLPPTSNINAIAKVGLQKFLFDLFWIGMFYHLYNQVITVLSFFLSQTHSNLWRYYTSVILSGGYEHTGKSRASHTRCRKRAETSLRDRVLHNCVWE